MTTSVAKSEMNTFMANSILVFFILCVISLCRTQAQEPKCSGPNEEYTCGVKCPKTCTNLDISIQCISGCDEGCFCKDGYVRNEETGECIKPTECPACGQNETYKSGGFACQTCQNYQYVRCASLNEYRCYCLPGYVRDANDNCIRIEDCPVNTRYTRNVPKAKCGWFESYEPNGFACQTCENHQQYLQCPELNEQRCYCYSGYVRNANGNCVHPEDCPVITGHTKNSTEATCGHNEIYEPSSIDCHTCENVECVLRNGYRCYCYEGYVRDATGNCVHPKDCPVDTRFTRNTPEAKCGWLESYQSKGLACQTCENHHQYLQCPELNEHRCYCYSGYVRNASGNCVHPEDCPVITGHTKNSTEATCGHNEIYQPEGFDCQTCRNHQYVQCLLLNEYRCYCYPGYVRDENGNCVRTQDCPVVTRHTRNTPEAKCGWLESYEFKGFACQTCENHHQYLQCPELNEHRCYCYSGYVRNASGNCVHPEDCPVTTGHTKNSTEVTCGHNEIYQPNGFNCQTCKNHQYVRCAPLNEYRCYCYPGYVRDENGNCVRTQDCPVVTRHTRNSPEVQCDRPNEEYSPCQPDPCEPTCQHTERGIGCAAVCVPNGCKCKQGFLRDALTRECVPEANCP